MNALRRYPWPAWLIGATLLMITLLFLWPRPISPRNASLIERTVQWHPVRGSSGYLIQVRGSDGTLLVEREVSEARADLLLNEGEYKLRVASLNKFGEPASWSGWTDLSVSTAREQPRPNLRPAPPAKTEPDVEAALPESQDFEDEGFRWSIFVPGLTQFQRGQWLRGSAYVAAFTGLAAAGYGSYQAGNGVAAAAASRNVLYFPAAFSGQPLFAFYLVQQDAAGRAAYASARAEQRTAGLAALGLYLVQIFDAVYLGPDTDIEEQSFWNIDTFARPAPVHFAAGNRPTLDQGATLRFTFTF